MGLLFKNNAETTLSGGINDSVTTISVASAAVFPTPSANNVFFATIDDGTNVEVVKVTGISSNDLTVVRAQDNTSASAFSTGAKVELRLNAKVLEMGTASLTDLDGDTKIEVEATADSDTIALTSNSGDFSFINSSNTIALIKTTNDDFTIQNNLNDKDFILKGYDSDGGGLITGLTIDYSNAGKATFGGDVALADSKKLVLGAGEDLQLYHDGSNSYLVDAGTGGLILRGTNTVDIQSALGHNYLKSTISAGTQIYYDNSEKFATVSGGVKVTGNIENASGSMTIDVADNLSLDVDGGNIALKDAGTQWGNFANNSGNFDIDAVIQDKDIKFNGYDGSSYINALTLDMSDEGSAIFNGHVNINNVGTDRKIQINRTGGKNFSIEHDTSGFYIYNLTDSSLHSRFTNGGSIGIGSNDPATDGYDYAEDLVIKAGASTNSDGAGLSIQNVGRRYGVIAFGDSASVHSGEIWYDHTLDSFNMRTAGTQRFSLDSSGNAIYTGNVTAYGSPSDIRLKENIEVIDNAVDKVKQLKGITYTLKSDGNRLTGLIAQDLEKVLPEAVYTTETVTDEREGEVSEEHLAIRYGNTVGLLVEAIKEQQEQIETLTAKVKELEGK